MMATVSKASSRLATTKIMLPTKFLHITSCINSHFGKAVIRATRAYHYAHIHWFIFFGHWHWHVKDGEGNGDAVSAGDSAFHSLLKQP
jgi:hypothetical protein